MADDTLEIGVTVPVPAPASESLSNIRANHLGLVGTGPAPHITLVPATRIAPADLPAFEDHIAKVAEDAPAVRVVLCGGATFLPVSPVAYACVAEGSWECSALAALLRSGPVEIPLNYPFHPHVTVAQGLSDRELRSVMCCLQGFVAEFTVTELLLSVCDMPGGGNGASWTPLRRFPIARALKPTRLDPKT